MSAYLDCRYLRFTLSDSGNPDNHLKGSSVWAGPVWIPTSAFFEYSALSPKPEIVGAPPVQVFKNHLEVRLTCATFQEALDIEVMARGLLGCGRMVVIPWPAASIPVAIGYLNYATGATLTATSSDASYPVTNMATMSLYARIWRSAAAALTNVSVTADFGSAKGFDLVGILGFNGTDSSTVRILAGESSSFASTEYDTVSAISCFDTTYTTLTLPTGRSAHPNFGRHLLYLPRYGVSPGNTTITRSRWTWEAILCTWDAENPPVRRQLASVPHSWEVVLNFLVCED